MSLAGWGEPRRAGGLVRGGPGLACHVGSSLLGKDGQTPGWDRERHPEVGPGRGPLLAFPGKGRDGGERREKKQSQGYGHTTLAR